VAGGHALEQELAAELVAGVAAGLLCDVSMIVHEIDRVDGFGMAASWLGAVAGLHDAADLGAP
jgi:hypothetical protein